MRPVEISQVINCRVDVVFMLIADVEGWPCWHPTASIVRRDSTRPVRRGCTFRMAGEDGGQCFEAMYTITAYEPGHRFGLATTSNAVHVAVDVITDDRGGSTQVRAGIHADVRGVARLVRPLITRRIKAQLTACLSALARYAERGQDAAVGMQEVSR